MLKKVEHHGNPVLKAYNRFVDVWNKGSSSTNDPADINPTELHNLMIDLRNSGRHDLASDIEKQLKQEGYK